MYERRIECRFTFELFWPQRSAFVLRSCALPLLSIATNNQSKAEHIHVNLVIQLSERNRTGNFRVSLAKE